MARITVPKSYTRFKKKGIKQVHWARQQAAKKRAFCHPERSEGSFLAQGRAPSGLSLSSSPSLRVQDMLEDRAGNAASLLSEMNR